MKLNTGNFFQQFSWNYNDQMFLDRHAQQDWIVIVYTEIS